MPFSSEFSDTNSELFDQKQITVTDTGVEAITDAGATDRACRQHVRIYNDGNSTIYVGPQGVTAPGGAKPGEPVTKRGSIGYDVRGDNNKVYMITSSGKTATVIVSDLG